MSPTYEFYCQECHLVIDRFFAMKDKPDNIQCPHCFKTADSIVSGGSGFLLKGHGWGFDRYAGPSNFSFGKDKKDD